MNNKGVTIVELLIVIVVMSIIALFSGTLVQNIIANTREDSFVNTATVMISSANTAYNQGDPLWNDNIATLQELIDNEYIEVSLTDPWGTQYDTTNSYVTVSLVLQNTEGELFLSSVMYLTTSEVLKVKLVSATATIGYDNLLEDFDKDSVIYLVDQGTFLNGIIENITGNLVGSLSGGNDNDSLTIENHAARNSVINTFDGDDTVEIGGDLYGNGILNAGSGEDTITIGRLRGRAAIDSGEDNDILVINEVRYYTVIQTGDGNDSVTITKFTTNYKGTINMGSGDDTLTINDSSAIYRIAGSISGGTGNDTLNLPGVTTSRWNEISSIFSGFETINLFDSTITN